MGLSIVVGAILASGSCARTAVQPATSPAPSATPPVAPASASSSAPKNGPPAALTRAVSLPTINHSALPNGLSIWHIPSRSLPVVQLRLVVKAGSNLDRDRPGLARMTALAIARSSNAPPAGAPASSPRPEVLVPEVQVDPGTTVFSLDLPKDHLEEGVDRLGAIARQPKLDSPPLGELRTHELQRTSEFLRDDPASVARSIATRNLLGLSQPATQQDLSKITAADCKAFHKAVYAPKNLGLVVVGDVTFDEAVQAARRALGTWDGAAGSAQPPAPPAPVQYTRVIVADRPSSADSVILLAMPGPAPADSMWPALWLAREHAAATARSCPPPNAATLLSLEAGAGPVPVSVCLTASTGQTTERIASAIDRLQRTAGEPMSAIDLDAARASFNETFATRLSSFQALADFAAFAMGAGMEHDQVGRQAAQVQSTTAEQVRDAVRARARDGMLVVVVGDASKLGDELSRFGDVTIVDPNEGFARKRQIPASPGAPSPRP